MVLGCNSCENPRCLFNSPTSICSLDFGDLLLKSMIKHLPLEGKVFRSRGFSDLFSSEERFLFAIRYFESFYLDRCSMKVVFFYLKRMIFGCGPLKARSRIRTASIMEENIKVLGCSPVHGDLKFCQSFLLPGIQFCCLRNLLNDDLWGSNDV